MELLTEYLIIIERRASEALYNLCDKVEVFNQLLEKDRDIKIDGNSIVLKQQSKFPYWITTGEVEGKEQRYFLAKVAFPGGEENLDEYTALLRAIRSIAIKSGGQLEILRDDVSLHYSTKAYPLIHRIENLMRKLITYFMFTRVGKEWVAEKIPSNVKEAIGKGKRKEVEEVNVLYQADFIHLGEVLFKAYPSKNVSELFEKLDKAQKLEDLNFTDLKEYGPQSNWKRYFSDIVECSNDFLDKKWNELYNLRCAVAHNSIVGKAEYERIERLVNEVGEYLQKAIDNLDKVHVPTEDKEKLAENIVGSINVDYESFLLAWRSFVSMLTRAVTDFGLPLVTSPYDALDSLSNNGFIDEGSLDEGLELLFVRDRMVHDARAAFTQQELNN